MDTPCYSLKEYIFHDPIFDTIDATYIIHLEGNGRLDTIMKQIQKYHPTKHVFVVFNKGFKKCKKVAHINKAPIDLIDAFYTVFTDAYKKGYNHILVLEDDFIFDDKINDKKHATSIERFLQQKMGQNYVYYIGTIPIIQTTFNTEHNRVLFSTGMHACIYPRTFITNLIENIDQKEVSDWDLYTNFNNTQYKYFTPLCYQLFPQTENQSQWGYDNFINKFFAKLHIGLLNHVHLDTNIHPGYTIFEFTSKFIFWFILTTIIMMNVFVNYFIFNNFKWCKKNWHIYIYIFIGINILYPLFILFVFLLLIHIQIIYYTH